MENLTGLDNFKNEIPSDLNYYWETLGWKICRGPYNTKHSGLVNCYELSYDNCINTFDKQYWDNLYNSGDVVRQEKNKEKREALKRVLKEAKTIYTNTRWTDNFNICLFTGEASGVIAIDVDYYKDEKTKTKYKEWESKGWLKGLPIAKTASGGRHIIVPYDEQFSRNYIGFGGYDIEIKSNGGLVMLNKSVACSKVDGKVHKYKWLTKPTLENIKEVDCEALMAELLSWKIKERQSQEDEEIIPSPSPKRQMDINKIMNGKDKLPAELGDYLVKKFNCINWNNCRIKGDKWFFNFDKTPTGRYCPFKDEEHLLNNGYLIYNVKNGELVRGCHSCKRFHKIIWNEITKNTDIEKAYKREYFGVAWLYQKYFGTDSLFCPKSKSFWCFDEKTGMWLEDMTNKIRFRVAEFVAPMFYEYACFLEKEAKGNIDDKLKWKIAGIRKIAKELYGATNKPQIFLATRQENDDFHKNINQNPDHFHFKNGVFDLKKSIFRERNPTDFSTFHSGRLFIEKPDMEKVNYINDWLIDVLEINENRDCFEFFLKFMRYILNGHMFSEKVIFFWTNTQDPNKEGDNAKSTVKEFLKELLGDYYYETSKDLFCMKKKDDGAGRATTEANGLQYKRLVVVSELKEGDKLLEDNIKRFTGEKTLTIRPLYKEQQTITNQSTPVIITNHLPGYTSKMSVENRIRVVEFPNQFVPNPTGKQKQKDGDKGDKLNECLDDYLSWLCKDAHLWYDDKKHKLKENVPDRYLKATMFYSGANDIYSKYVLEELAKNTNWALYSCVSRSYLWRHFQKWCDDNDIEQVAKGEALKGLHRKIGEPKESGGYRYSGWKLIDNMEPEEQGQYKIQKVDEEWSEVEDEDEDDSDELENMVSSPTSRLIEKAKSRKFKS